MEKITIKRKDIEEDRKQKIDWCAYHNLPMTRCNKTSSMRCELVKIPISMAYDIASDKDYIGSFRNVKRGLTEEIKKQEK